MWQSVNHWVVLTLGAIALRDNPFHETILPMSVTDLQCSGSESDILTCGINSQPVRSCAQTEDAGVVCQGM